MNAYASLFKSLTDIGTVGRGKSKHRPRNAPELYNGAYPFIQTADVKHANFYITEYNQTYNEKGLAQSKLWEPGTLCITIAANIADTAILKIPACFPDSIIGFISKKSISDVVFVKYCLDIYKEEMLSISRGTTQDNLSQGKLLSLRFRIPPYNEQIKIAAILSAYDELIETNRRRIVLLENLAEELYREWFLRHRFPGHQKAKFDKGIPIGWEVSRVDSIGRIVTGKTPSTEVSRYYGGTYPFIKTPDMHGCTFVFSTSETLTEDGIKSQNIQTIPKNSICISCIGTGGVVSISTATCQTNQQINSIILNDMSDLEWAFFTIKNLKETIRLFGSTGTTMTNLSKGKFSALKIISPDKNIRLKFHEKTTSIFSQIQVIAKQTRNLTDTRDMLLRRLISGNLQVEALHIHFPNGVRDETPAIKSKDVQVASKKKIEGELRDDFDCVQLKIDR